MCHGRGAQRGLWFDKVYKLPETFFYRLRRLGLHSEGTNALDRGPVPEIILYIKVFLGLI